ncbi:zinc transporter ZIP1 [Patella vulgata]|uniref:zinc transporter ZIP1 n=1 Tax=Patella vulgata TaxID=6465 RepID=UPI00217F62AC|nr:zinc transporter ZIP1 [Patella vulgata]
MALIGSLDILESKLLSLFLLLILTFIFGFLPFFVLIKSRVACLRFETYETITYLLNSFAGGVFLGTCLLHLLAEGREELELALELYGIPTDYPLYEAIAAVGLFIIVIIDFVAHFFLNRRSPKTDRTDELKRPRQHQRYTRYDSLLGKEEISSDNQGAVTMEPEITSYGGRVRSDSNRSDSNLSHAHDLFQLTNIQSMTKVVLLLIALSFQTIFDGLPVGLQVSSANVWESMIEVSLHKSLVAFCLGIQLFNIYISKPGLAVGLLFFFSLMSPLGLAIGIGNTTGHIQNAPILLSSSILRAIATGTFLYVTCFEILRECFVVRRSIWNILMAVVGFGAMAAVKCIGTD